MNILKNYRLRDEGQTLVEFALVLPILLILLVAVIDFGWVFMAKLTITNASREAVRYYAVNKVSNSAVISVAQQTMGVITDSSYVVYVDDEDPVTKAKMAYIRITASVDPLVGFVFKEKINISSEAFMRFEYE